MATREMPLYYWDYLQLDQLLGAQQPVSARRGEPALPPEVAEQMGFRYQGQR